MLKIILRFKNHLLYCVYQTFLYNINNLHISVWSIFLTIKKNVMFTVAIMIAIATFFRINRSHVYILENEFRYTKNMQTNTVFLFPQSANYKENYIVFVIEFPNSCVLPSVKRINEFFVIEFSARAKLLYVNYYGILMKKS